LTNDLARRRFIQRLGLGGPRAPGRRSSGGQALRGIFPIAQTPFSESEDLDLNSLVRELEFVHRTGVHGFVWPQLASEWSTLTETESRKGAEALVTAGKKWKPAIVIGVQDPDAATAVRYTGHAAKIGADAVIALPPPGQPHPDAISYYQQIGNATELPLFVQAVGDMSVDFILKMWKAVPTLKLIKDEAGEPLMRIERLRHDSRDDIEVFTGAHGRTLIDEMYRGTSGTMPAVSLADIYASCGIFGSPGNVEKRSTFSAKCCFSLPKFRCTGSYR
jgi:4-hydroxy-tetrahydrodipicolinate synthase